MNEEDLVLGEATEDKEVEIEMIDPHNDIAAAYNALAAIDDFDAAVQTEADRRRIRQIKRMCIRIIHEHIRYIYQTNFGNDNGED